MKIFLFDAQLFKNEEVDENMRIDNNMRISDNRISIVNQPINHID